VTNKKTKNKNKKTKTACLNGISRLMALNKMGSRFSFGGLGFY